MQLLRGLVIVLLFSFTGLGHATTSDILILSGSVAPEISIGPGWRSTVGSGQQLSFNIESNILIGFKILLNGVPLSIRYESYSLAYLRKIVVKKINQSSKDQFVTVVVN